MPYRPVTQVYTMMDQWTMFTVAVYNYESLPVYHVYYDHI